MKLREEPRYTQLLLDRTTGANPNAMEIRFGDGTSTGPVEVEYPIGHRRRREEGMPLLIAKFKTNLARRFPAKQQQAVLDVTEDAKKLEATPVNEFVDMMTV